MMKHTIIAALLLVAISFTAVSAQTESPTSSTASSKFTVPVVKAWLTRTYNTIEVFRNKEAVYFAGVRDELKTKLKIDQKPAPTVDIGVAGSLEEVKKENSIVLDSPVDYVKYIGSISLATLFSNQLIFYISGLLLTLIVVRFVMSRLV